MSEMKFIINGRMLKSNALTILRKASLLSSLYFTQTIPKGYLKYLPISMAEKGNSMFLISFVALLSWGDWFKPFFGCLLDTKRLSSMKDRKKIILIIQSSMMLLLFLSTLIPESNLFQIASLLSLCCFLASIHDTAVDGFAVHLLDGHHEKSFGGFGQYFGHKIGTLFSTGLLPVFFGSSHKSLGYGSIIAMMLVYLYTMSFSTSEKFDEKLPVEMSASPSPSTSILQTLSSLASNISVIQVMMLILYKLADHGLDFIWGPALVNAKINRKVILQTQFILGTFAAIVGSFIGTILTDYLKNPSFALMITSILRIIPNFMQLLFLQNPSFQNERFIMLHSLFENIIGSAVTGSMFSFLLETSDSRFPATSYAFMNSLNLIGMSLGEFSLGQLSFSLGFKEVVWIGISINLLFSYLVYLYSQSSKQSKD